MTTSNMASSHYNSSIITNISPLSSRQSSPTSSPSSQPTSPYSYFTTSSTSSTRTPTSNAIPSLFPSPSPRVQLVPHTRTLSFDATFSASERRSIDNLSFDARDCASQDFDFEDIFTYDRPHQPKFASVVEVSMSAAPRREVLAFRPQFSFSHYGANQGAGGVGVQGGGAGGKARYQQQNNRNRTGTVAEMYLKNHREAKRK